LIAARVRERCHRPTIAFAKESDGYLKGSARSIPGVHVRDLLEGVSGKHSGLIEKFGGHAMAAGLTIAASNYEEFSRAVAKQVDSRYPDADFSGAIVSDGVLTADDIARCGGLLPTARALREAGPWGSAFPEPLWNGDFTILEQRTVGEKHLKLRVRPAKGGDAIEAIAFNQAGPAYRGTVQLAYRLDVNEYRGVESPQLVVEQIASLHSDSA
jgi:single-stranded-DNA-specific exonuclease